MRPYPYGFVRDPHACNADLTDIYEAGGARIKDLRAKHGAHPKCESPFGVRNLSGNLEEFVTIDGSGPVRPAMMGAWWQPSQNHCRARQTAHGPTYKGRETGFRCCGDVTDYRPRRGGAPLTFALNLALPRGAPHLRPNAQDDGLGGRTARDIDAYHLVHRQRCEPMQEPLFDEVAARLLGNLGEDLFSLHDERVDLGKSRLAPESARRWGRARRWGQDDARCGLGASRRLQ